MFRHLSHLFSVPLENVLTIELKLITMRFVSWNLKGSSGNKHLILEGNNWCLKALNLFSVGSHRQLHYRQCLRPVVTFMGSPRRYKANGKRDEEESAGLWGLRLQAMDLQHKLQNPWCTHSLSWQQETLLTSKWINLHYSLVKLEPDNA